MKAGRYPENFRPKQLPPDHPRHHDADAKGYRCGCEGTDDDYVIWMLMAGRGHGKSLVGSTWIVRQALKQPDSEWAVFAPTFRDVRKVCIEGSTGILAALSTAELANYRRNELQIQLSNGSVIYGYSADQPERARGANLSGAWCVARGEVVTTSDGLVAIEDVTPGMMVWTRSGYRRVLAARMTARDAPVLRVTSVGGMSVRLTAEHRVWAGMYGWVQAKDLRLGYKLRRTVGDDYCDRVAPDGAADVFDLTVEGSPEFFASGLLVHNCEELGSWRYESTWHEGLVPALRKGKNPRIVVTTTPRPTKLIKDLTSRKDGSVHITRGSTWENEDNLSATALAELRRRYEGTRIGRQELEGELLEDIEGALWSRANIDADRVKPSEVPDLTRVVVAIDPAVTSNEDSDESGIVVVGHAGDHGYVLGDYSLRGTPNEVINKAIHAYHVHNADVIVAEVNNGGDWIGSLLRTVDTNIPYRTVRASRGKAIRAQPVSSLYEQHRMHHVGSFPEMEDEMCGFVPGIPGDSPNRMDALVWGGTDLTGIVGGDWNDAYGTGKCFTCGHTYVLAGHPKCPKCGTMN